MAKPGSSQKGYDVQTSKTRPTSPTLTTKLAPQHLGGVNHLDLSGDRRSPRVQARLEQALGQSRVRLSRSLQRRLVVNVQAAAAAVPVAVG